MTPITTTSLTYTQILDLADWHDEHARQDKKEGNDKGAERHNDIADRLCVRAYRLRRAT